MAESRGIVEGNYFQGSLTCVKFQESYPQIRRNYFKQAYKNVIESNNKSDLIAEENWWGAAEVDVLYPALIVRWSLYFQISNKTPQF